MNLDKVSHIYILDGTLYEWTDHTFTFDCDLVIGPHFHITSKEKESKTIIRVPFTAVARIVESWY